MPEKPPENPGIESIAAALARARAALWRARLIEGVGILSAAALSLVLALAALDNLFWLPAGARIAAASSAAAILLAVFIRAAVPCLRRMSDDAAALFIESALPGLENRVINAVQISRQTLTGWSHLFAGRAVSESARALASAGTARPDMKRARTAWAASAALGIVLALYAALSGGRFENAALRYMKPFDYLSPVSSLRLSAAPGDAEVFKGEDFTVHAAFEGPVPDAVGIETVTASGTRESAMEFASGSFELTFKEVSEPFKYRCFRGAVTTPMHSVSVKTRPSVKRIDLRLEYPAYSGIPAATIENSGGDVTALAGTRVVASVTADKPLSRAAAVFASGFRIDAQHAVDSFSFSFEVHGNDSYSIALADAEGIESRGDATRLVRAVPDAPPQARITSPARDLSIEPGTKVPVNFSVRDDVGVKSVVLRARSEPSGEEKALRTFEPASCPAEFSDSFLLDPALLGLKPGESLTYQVSAYDGLGQAGRSHIYIIRIAASSDPRKRMEGDAADLLARLKALLRSQKLNTARTVLLIEAGSPAALKSKTRGILPLSCKEQAAVMETAGKIVESVQGRSVFESSVRSALLDLAANEMPRASSEAATASGIEDPAALLSSLKILRMLQESIEAKIEDLIKGVEEYRDKLKAGEAPEAEADRRRLLDRAEVLRNMKDALSKFVEDQKQIIRETRELASKPVADFTEADDKKAQGLAEAEERLAKIIKDLMDDLSRLPDQDMSDSTVAEELVEIYVEVEKAADALTRKTVEMAVPFEQSGAELAEQLTKNLEKWLPDVRDNIKWNMEDPVEDHEVPLVDLPEELEDMVGDLIEDQNDLEEDVEDVSSKWADSLDKGAGWSTADGPISNMSAQGKTGNYLPNNNEVGGRSGEGRTGRSHGQMVEKTATGKGGRQTPFRKTDDPYEAGKVDDKSNDPGGGATGGGKLSGAGADGQRGQTPPPLEKELGRLSGKQAEIREKAEKLERGLKTHRYPAGGIENAVLLMKKAEDMLKAGRIADFAAMKKDIMIRLAEADAAVHDELQVNREAFKAMPRGLREDLKNVKKEAMPEKYREFLMAYYRMLSKGGK